MSVEPLRSGDPEVIGEYKLVARLGAGGMGVVFLGTRGADRVAIKVMRSSFFDDPSLRTRFEREIDTLKRVRSPYVAQYSDSALEQDFAWHAVEFVNGPTLREWIDARGPLPEEQWWELAEQLKLALDSIHAMGIVHRDVKPSNIIMSDQGAKLIDFGISQDSEATSVTTTGMVAGSPAWLSPEQLEGATVLAGSDLYSVGSVLVFAGTGRSPWGNEKSMSIPVIYQKILTGEVNFDGLNSEQRKLVEALQRKNPLERSFGTDDLGNLGLAQSPGANDESSQRVKTVQVETKGDSPAPKSRSQASLTGQLEKRWERRLDVVTQQLPLEVVSTTEKQAGIKSLARFFLVVMGGIVIFAVVAGLFSLGN